MNTIPIDQRLYKAAALYANEHKVSLQTIVEKYLTQLLKKDSTPKTSENAVVLQFDELQPELQEILDLSAPMKGTVPEWDLNGDVAREESLKNISASPRFP